jgi:hypothetical protein
MRLGSRLACTDNTTGWITPSSQPRTVWNKSSNAKTPPRSGVIAISRMDSAVPLNMVRCASPRRIARPAKSAPNPLAISAAANRMPIVVPTSPLWPR